MRGTYIVAIIIATGVVLWLASGMLRDKPPSPPSTLAEKNERARAMQEERSLARVRVQTSHAVDKQRLVTIRGQTEAKRKVEVKSQIDGLIVRRPVERGDVVATGDLLCEVSVEDRKANLEEASLAVKQATLEFDGSKRLSREGLQSGTAIAQAEAALGAARAHLERANLNLQRLNITAPFNGVVEAVHIDQGDLVSSGVTCVTLVDLDPMLVVGQVPEGDVEEIRSDTIANILIGQSQRVSGRVSFIARTADSRTRTYAIELQLANPDHLIPGGMTALMKVPVELVRAHRVPHGVLSLDDKGRVGLRTVDDNNRVVFHLVRVLEDGSEGMWVGGLPDTANVITVGQEMVVPGEEVEYTFDTPINAPIETLLSPGKAPEIEGITSS